MANLLTNHPTIGRSHDSAFSAAFSKTRVISDIETSVMSRVALEAKQSQAKMNYSTVLISSQDNTFY